MDFNELIKSELKKYKIISIIGLAKNVSKTTTLNHILQVLKGNYQLGLTSIGRDGEKYDAITSLPKPRIFIETGTIIATALQSLRNSEVKSEIIKKTGITTPMGEIHIAKALNSGFIEIAGPSINSELKQVCDDLLNFGCDLVLIDGAFDRRSYASPLISQATILSTGASVSREIQEVINITQHTVNLLTLENEENIQIINLANKIISKAKVGIIHKNNSIKILDLLTALDSVEEILDQLNDDAIFLVINGAVTDEFIEDLIKKSDIYKRITVIVSDATKLFLSKSVFEKYSKKGGCIKVLDKIKIIVITINPTSPLGYEFDKLKFLNELKQGITIPIFDLGPSKY
ncbi:MAG: hypothetical protein KGD73_05880 [Candidatus Lokiarchaeota archaeon]|nr:hypothetical protein [Candidatus Lokiarchaeota archaeon]